MELYVHVEHCNEIVNLWGTLYAWT